MTKHVAKLFVTIIVVWAIIILAYNVAYALVNYILVVPDSACHFDVDTLIMVYDSARIARFNTTSAFSYIARIACMATPVVAFIKFCYDVDKDNELC